MTDASVAPDRSDLTDGSAQGRDGNAYHLDADVDLDGCPTSMQHPCPSPLPDGCGTQELCGNGLDDDCNGQVDEGCSCTVGDVQPCFLGPPSYVSTGACTSGTQTCQGSGEFATWGPCEGGIWPTPEVCDDLDNDCNGCADDGLCCEPPLSCPDPGDIADAQPFVPYHLEGSQWYSGPANSWKWEIEGGPCDQLLGNTSYEITADNTSHPTITFTLSGDYTVTMTVTTDSGTYTCTFIVHVVGPGLRVELCWEGTGNRDIDLHLLRSDFHADWCANDDCFFDDCKATNWDMGSWGYQDGPIAECAGTPMGSDWQSRGSCANPRLDIDNIDDVGIPENINVDAPGEGQSFRVMVHYFGGQTGEAHPLVNVYCDGHRIATYGQTPNQVTGFTTPGQWDCQGDSWRVADVVTHDNNGHTTCNVTALHPNNQTSGYRVLHNDTSY